MFDLHSLQYLQKDYEKSNSSWIIIHGVTLLDNQHIGMLMDTYPSDVTEVTYKQTPWLRCTYEAHTALSFCDGRLNLVLSTIQTATGHFFKLQDTKMY